MKKILILAIGILLSVGSIVAQNQQRGERRPFNSKERIEMLKKELKLTDEQTQQLTTIYADFDKKMKEADRGNREQMRANMEELNKNVENILTDEQKKEYKKIQERNRNRRPGGGNRGGAPRR